MLLRLQAKEKPTEGSVIAAGPGRLHPETAVLMPMCVKPGESRAAEEAGGGGGGGRGEAREGGRCERGSMHEEEAVREGGEEGARDGYRWVVC